MKKLDKLTIEVPDRCQTVGFIARVSVSVSRPPWVQPDPEAAPPVTLPKAPRSHGAYIR